MRSEKDLLAQGIEQGRAAVERSVASGRPWYYGLFPFLQKVKLVYEHRDELPPGDSIYIEIIWKRIMNYLEGNPGIAREFIEWNKANPEA